jgi:hypothetical protein
MHKGLWLQLISRSLARLKRFFVASREDNGLVNALRFYSPAD